MGPLTPGQQQGQDALKMQPTPVTVAMGNITNAALSAVSPDQIAQVQMQQNQTISDQEGQPSKRLRRVACSCPNCRDGEGRQVQHGESGLLQFLIKSDTGHVFIR